MSADLKLRVRGREIYSKSEGIGRSKWDMRAELKTKTTARQRQKNMHRRWKFEKKVDREADSEAKRRHTGADFHRTEAHDRKRKRG